MAESNEDYIKLNQIFEKLNSIDRLNTQYIYDELNSFYSGSVAKLFSYTSYPELEKTKKCLKTDLKLIGYMITHNTSKCFTDLGNDKLDQQKYGDFLKKIKTIAIINNNEIIDLFINIFNNYNENINITDLIAILQKLKIILIFIGNSSKFGKDINNFIKQIEGYQNKNVNVLLIKGILNKFFNNIYQKYLEHIWKYEPKPERYAIFMKLFENFNKITSVSTSLPPNASLPPDAIHEEDIELEFPDDEVESQEEKKDDFSNELLWIGNKIDAVAKIGLYMDKYNLYVKLKKIEMKNGKNIMKNTFTEPIINIPIKKKDTVLDKVSSKEIDVNVGIVLIKDQNIVYVKIENIVVGSNEIQLNLPKEQLLNTITKLFKEKLHNKTQKRINRDDFYLKNNGLMLDALNKK